MNLHIQRAVNNHNLLEVALDLNRNHDERFEALAICIRANGEHTNDLLQEAAFNSRERQNSIKKTVDAAIKHFQTIGHVKVCGAILGEVVIFFTFPLMGLFSLVFAIAVGVDALIRTYHFEQELRVIKSVPKDLKALGSTTQEVEKNIKKLWKFRRMEESCEKGFEVLTLSQIFARMR